MELREYREEDIEEMADLFHATVHAVCSKDYTAEQRGAWSSGQVDREAWNCSFLKHDTLVAVFGKQIVGFGDMADDGYLDRLYVHKDHQGKGVATLICNSLEDRLRSRINTSTHSHQPLRFYTHASITARPFFEHRGYVMLHKQEVWREGVALVNYVMEKKVGPDPA